MTPGFGFAERHEAARGETMTGAKNAARPDCPCDFCVRVRAEIAEGRSENDEQNKIAEDFLRSYSRKK